MIALQSFTLDEFSHITPLFYGKKFQVHSFSVIYKEKFLNIFLRIEFTLLLKSFLTPLVLFYITSNINLNTKLHKISCFNVKHICIISR